MYGLKQAVIIAFNQLFKKLAPAVYYPMSFTPGLWHHHTKRTMFILCVDDFGVKYFSKADTQHLIDAIQSHYDLTIDCTGTLYCGLNLNCHYNSGYFNVSMPDYVTCALTKFGHKAPEYAQHSPQKWIAPVYGYHQTHNTNPKSKAPLLNKLGTLRIQ